MKVELLAPAGSLENFQAAVDSGADAVYVGAPGLNARNPARELSFAEIRAIVERSRELGKKIYFALNSLVLERELRTLLRDLALYEKMAPDALIVQDFGLVELVRRHFPGLFLHGSTLMTVHNSEGVRRLQRLGFERAVLARELTLKEIESISRRSDGLELEIFVHGAMCFSFSGLCLFSSWLGGKSGLRGRCVQPCRRAWSESRSGRRTRGRQGKTKGGSGRYLFSMNDLNGLEALSPLVRLGVSSLKIEGRLRSAHYVQTVVRACRTVLDSLSEDGSEGPDSPQALAEGQRLVELALSRRTHSGYFFTPQPAEAITPMVSGNIGSHLGRFTVVKMAGGVPVCRFVLKAPLQQGDRLRLHREPSGERSSFRLKRLFVGGEERQSAAAGERVSLELPEGFIAPATGHVELFRVDGAAVAVDSSVLKLDEARAWTERVMPGSKRRAVSVAEEFGLVAEAELSAPPPAGGSGRRRQLRAKGAGEMKGPGLEWWLGLDTPEVLKWQFPFAADRLLFSWDRRLLTRAGQLRRELGRRARSVVWALPPIFLENDLGRVRRQLDLLVRTGFRSFQLSHFSQLNFFTGDKVHLFGSYTLNVMNSAAARFYRDHGLEGVQAAIELDHAALAALGAGVRSSAGSKVALGMQVYGAPPLYTSRLDHPFPLEKELLSPRGEPCVVSRRDGFTVTRPGRPFSLLAEVDSLRRLGFSYVVVDTCGHSRKKDLEELSARLVGNGRYRRLSTFNYYGRVE